jgi:hypothetical protein
MHKMTRNVAFVLLAGLSTGGCDSFLDVNKNPNAPVSARVDLTLPAVEGIFGHSVLTGSLAYWTVEWMQQISFTGNTRAYSNLHRYEVTSIDANGPWEYIYARVMKEAQNIIVATEGTEDFAYRGIAEFLKAWSVAIATDSWGPVPYTEALNTAIRDPKYDEQKVVYEGVMKDIDQAIADMKKPARSPGAADLLYKGDMTRWVKLAYVIQAQSHIRLSGAPGENKTDRAQKALTALAQGFSSNADDADFAYPGGSGRRPTWNGLRNNDGPGSLVHSELFIERMKARNDPRIPIYARPAPSDTPNAIVYRGHKSGSGSGTLNTFSRVNNYFAGDSAFANWVSYSHAKFLEAEARLIVSGAAAADPVYRAAIRANMEKVGVAEPQIVAYLAARPSLATVPNALAEIMQEKSVANFLKLEVWNDWRRTGFPTVPVVTSEYLTAIPQRIRTPDTELTNNADKVKETGINPTLVGMLTKVWWASQTP